MQKNTLLWYRPRVNRVWWSLSELLSWHPISLFKPVQLISRSSFFCWRIEVTWTLWQGISVVVPLLAVTITYSIQHAPLISVWIGGRSLQWRHNERTGVSNHRRFDCLFNRLFIRRSKKISKLRVTVPLWGEFTGNRWIPLTKGQ